MVSRAGLVALVAIAAVALPGSAAALVEKGTIRVNRGGAGITLGMTRAQVVAKLGKPLFENANGYMQYADVPNLFDVYLDASSTPKRVRLVGISGERFCFPAGFCMFRKGAVGKLKKLYGASLKVVRLESGERVYRVAGSYRECDVFTDFTPRRFRSSARLIIVFVGFESGSAC